MAIRLAQGSGASDVRGVSASKTGQPKTYEGGGRRADTRGCNGEEDATKGAATAEAEHGEAASWGIISRLGQKSAAAQRRGRKRGADGEG